MELAEDCVRMCHVLKSVTEGRDTDDFDDPSKKWIEDLGRFVNPAQPSPLSVTSDIRVVCNIKSVVNEWADHPHGLREHHPDSTEERLVTSRAEMWGILRSFDVCGSRLTVPAVS